MTIRSTKEIKRLLLKKAIKEGRGPEMIYEIQQRTSLIKKEFEKDKEEFEKIKMLNEGQPRSVQMLNVLCEDTFLYVGNKNFIDEEETTIN